MKTARDPKMRAVSLGRSVPHQLQHSFCGCVKHLLCRFLDRLMLLRLGEDAAHLCKPLALHVSPKRSLALRVGFGCHVLAVKTAIPQSQNTRFTAAFLWRRVLHFSID